MDELDTLAEQLYQSWRYEMVMRRVQPAHTLPFNYSDLPEATKLVWRKVVVDAQQLLKPA